MLLYYSGFIYLLTPMCLSEPRKLLVLFFYKESRVVVSLVSARIWFPIILPLRLVRCILCHCCESSADHS